MKKLKFYWHYVNNVWYDIKYGIVNIFKYFKIIWNLRHWDFVRTFDFQIQYLKELSENIENSYELSEYKVAKLTDIRRCIELMENIKRDDYSIRCGYIQPDNFWFEPTPRTEQLPKDQRTYIMKSDAIQTDKELRVIFNKANKLAKAEWNELWDTIKKGNASDYNCGANSWCD